MKIGIICAMEEEIRLLVNDISIKENKVMADREFYLGELYSQEVVLVKSRIGKVASATTATLLISQFGVDCIIFAGTAGGLAPDLFIGDVVVGDLTTQHDFFVPGDPLFKIPLINVSYFKSDEALTQKLYEASKKFIKTDLKNDIAKEYLDECEITEPKVVIGTIASGDQFIADEKKHKWLAENVQNGKCVEMEGGAVAQVCYEFNIPFTLVRVISDGANQSSSVAFDKFVENTACHYTRGCVKAFLESINK